MTEVVAEISRKILVQQFITFQLPLNYSLVFDRSHDTAIKRKCAIQ